MTGATTLRTSPGNESVRLPLAPEDELPGAILNLYDVWYIPKCLANLISQGKLNDAGVHYNDENWRLYENNSRKVIKYVFEINNCYV